MINNNFFKSFIKFIKRMITFGYKKAEDHIPIEDQLELQRNNLIQERDKLINGKELSKVRGMKKQTEEEYYRLKKEQYRNNYGERIKKLKNVNREEAKNLLEKKIREDNKIEEYKNRMKEADKNDEKIIKRLNILDRQIEEYYYKIKELEERNRIAKQKNEMYKLMNKLNSITNGLDEDNIEKKIKDIELESNGREAEFERQMSGVISTYDIDRKYLDDILDRDY